MTDTPYNAWNIPFKNKSTFKKTEELLKELIKYGLLAPSSHNTQPWKFKIAKDSITIFADRSRALAYSDRSYRELYISLGAALGNILVAASHYQMSYTVSYLPEDELEDVAVRITFNSKKEEKL